jgi:rubrerythrin
MILNTDNRNSNAHIATLEILLHALAHERESQAYLQMAVRVAEDAEMKAFLIGILGQEQLHETLLRNKLREKYNLDV